MLRPYAAVDWGTSTLRVWLVGPDGGALGVRESAEGLRAAAPDRFEPILEGHLAALGAAADTPVVACGMVGARGGWREAAYLEAPTPLDRLADGAVRVRSAARVVRILPGVRLGRAQGGPDVMRGEETQLAGALALAGETAAGDGLYCLPGTHSKWARLSGGRLERFATYMTGELHRLLAEGSILAATLGGATADPASSAFREAAIEAAAAPEAVTRMLFSVRATALLEGLDGEAAASRLSGLLIGAEIGAAARHESGSEAVRLIGAGAVASAYAAAFAALRWRITAIDGATAARAGLHRAAARLFAAGGLAQAEDGR